MFRRSLWRLDFRTQKIGDISSPMIARNDGGGGGGVDHLAVDMGSILANAYRVTRDLVGPERDREVSLFINKNVVFAILKKLRPRKSAAFFFDGTDPLWKTRRVRKVPHKSSAQRFVRSAGSPLPFVVEDRLRSYLVESKMTPNELMISGPGVPGPAEAKISAWALDLAERSDVTANDSISLVGGSDLVVSALAITPFHYVSSVMMDRGDFKQTTVPELYEWLGYTSFFRSGDNRVLSRARTDAALLFLLTGGISATNLSALPNVGFKDIFEPYVTHFLSSGKFLTVDVPQPSSPPAACDAGTDDHPSFSPTLGVHAHNLADLIARAACKKMLSKPRLEASGQYPEYLEVLLQSLCMVADGGIYDYGYVTTEPLDAKTHPSQPLQSERLVAHLKAMPSDTVLKARADESFAVTAAEQCVLGAISVDLIDDALPAFAGGHSLPPQLSESVLAVGDTLEALEKVRKIMNSIKPRMDHRAFLHCPSLFFARKPGDSGPPPGWSYSSVNLGVNSRKAATRARLASDAKSGVSIDIKIKNALVCFDGENVWKESDVKLPSTAHPTTLRLVTWNVQFDRFSGQTTPLGKPGIDWCTKTRYVALSNVLSTTDADIITMQETEPTWWEYLSRQQWVQQHYAFSCPMRGDPITPWGQLMLINKRLPVTNMLANNVPGYTGHTSVMPTCQLSLKPGITLAVCGIHLLAPYTQSNINVRVTQIETLMKKLSPKNMGDDLVVLGDFNDYPANFFVMPPAMGAFQDAWVAIHGDKDGDAGYSINGRVSKYTSLIIEPEFFGRADRILFKSKHLKPTGASLIGTRSVREELGIASCPDYLFPSDHFGVMASFDVL